MKRNKIVLISAILVAVVMILSSLVVLFPATPQGSHSGSTTTTAAQATQPSQLSSRGSSIMNTLQSKGIPQQDVYLPSFNKPMMSGTNISGPSYLSAPAPMGIGTYGFSNNSGVINRYTLNTSSFEGSVSINNFSTFYALNDGPNSVTIQLNSILNNVTLFGVSNYTFWNQNVLFYSARSNTIQFLDNIWNFSSPAFNMAPNTFSSYGGNVVSPVYYYSVGPVLNVTFPFTVNLYLNSTVMNGDNTVFFNYTVMNSTGTYSGSYDKVQFNSTYGMPAGYSAPQANYYVTSTNVTPTGFIPYDSEIMLGGPGGGSTAMVNQINATMMLKYKDATNKYANVPSAYDVGSETGETSTGIAETWTPNAVAHLSAGPSFVYGMWNVSQTNTFDHFKGTVNPPNSFMFVGQGSAFNASSASWMPLQTDGSYSFGLPQGTYNAQILMSNHNPISTMLSSGSTQAFNLPLNYAQGVYAPLYAYNNAQLQYISFFGTGTSSNPYMLYNNPSPSGYLNPVFSTFNDYQFPEFNGVLLHGTTANVVMNNMPSFEVQYTLYGQAHSFASTGIVFNTNHLGYVLYDAQNVVLKNTAITGWFSAYLTEFPVANVLLWNSQNNLIMDNSFSTMDSSLLIYNTVLEPQYMNGGNVVYGNSFVQYGGLNATNFPGIAVSTSFSGSQYGPVAMSVYSNGNQIHSNFVLAYYTAISPYYSIYSGNFATYVNNWNGNFWWNASPKDVQHHGFDHGSSTGFYNSYGHKNLHVYNNNGLIYIGGDYHALFTQFAVSHHRQLQYYVTNFTR